MKSTARFSTPSLIIAAAVCFAATAASAADKKDSNWRELTAMGGLKNWRLADPKAEGTADWKDVLAAGLARDNPRLLRPMKGKGGVIVNGPTGKTKNLVSKARQRPRAPPEIKLLKMLFLVMPTTSPMRP